MSDAYWTDLGVTWRAEVPDVNAFTVTLRAVLRRAVRYDRLRLAWDVAAGTIGSAFGLLFVWRAMSTGVRNYAAEGMLILSVIAASLGLSAWARRVRGGDTADLSGMLTMSIVQAERRRRRALVYYFTAPMMLIFLIGLWFVNALGERMLPKFVLRYEIGSAFAITFIVGSVIWAISQHRRAKDDLARFRHLQALLVNRVA